MGFLMIAITAVLCFGCIHIHLIYTYSFSVWLIGTVPQAAKSRRLKARRESRSKTENFVRTDERLTVQSRLNFSVF